jgi:hypothetical protein
MEDSEFTRYEGGHTSKRRLGAAAGAASTLLVISLIAFLSIGSVGAALGVGVGGFVANFEEVNAPSGGEVFPILDEQPSCDEAPQLRASLDGTTKLNGSVEFFKDLPLPSSGFDSGDFARVSIVAQSGSSPIQVEDLGISLTALETESLSLQNADIREFANNSYEVGFSGYGVKGSYLEPGDGRGASAVNDPSKDAMDPSSGGTTTPEFGIDAPGGFKIENGSAAAHLVNFGSITLNELNIFVQILNENNDNLANGSVARVVNPTERTCEALAEASQAGAVDENSTAKPAGPQLGK